MKRSRLILAATLMLCALTAWAWQEHARARNAPPTLAAMLPQGALLTIESPDFATLLADWNTSPQARAWLASDNYNVFSNSRLFSRLSDAQDEFFATAFQGTAPASSALLTQVAGKQSIFAWYNVGNLEFLYITRMASAQQLQTALLQQRSHFAPRQAGGQTFYIRTSKDSPARTVAFATVPDPAGKGDLLLLATREDLLAGALTLLAGEAPSTALAAEPWYTEANAALVPESASRNPTLHMVLNLERIVPMAYFRSYWVQQNITEMAQYRSAVADLYRDPGAFREERALLPKAPADPADHLPDLAALAAMPPADGVFRATATQDPALAVTALEEKLLGRQHKPAQTAEQAPDAELAPSESGSTSDLETRIDAPAPVSATYSNEALTAALKSAGLDAVLTYSSAQQPSATAPLWVPIHNEVILHASGSWNLETLEAALQQSLRGTLTTARLGIEFRPATQPHVYTLTGPKPLFLALTGNLALLSDDEKLLAATLQKASAPESKAGATTIAGFNHTAQRAPFARLTSLIDSTNSTPAADPDTPKTPAFFSQNLRSLSDAFAALQSERFTETRQGATTRQTVLYQWTPQ